MLSKGQLIEVDRSGLVAGFVGQTAIKTGEVIDHAGGAVAQAQLSALIGAPGPNGTGAVQGQGEVRSRGDGGDIGALGKAEVHEGGRQVHLVGSAGAQLAQVVATPGVDAAVHAQGQSEAVAGGHLRQDAECMGDLLLAGHGGAVGLRHGDDRCP